VGSGNRQGFFKLTNLRSEIPLGQQTVFVCVSVNSRDVYQGFGIYGIGLEMRVRAEGLF